jgi:predicted negative regulator of RcsB-dependent stress response
MRLSAAAIVTATESGETWPRSIALRIATEVQVAAAAPDLAAAEKSIQSAIDIQTERQCKCDLAWSHLVHGDVLAAKGNHKAANEAYGTAKDMFGTLQIDRGTELTKTAMAALRALAANAG